MIIALLIGLLCGLRALTPPALVAWAAHFGWLELPRPLSLLGSLPVALLLALGAVAEYVWDKLPATPSRTEARGLVARITMGGLCGACVAAGGGSAWLAGALLGALGGVAGCFGGYQARTRLVKALRVPDYYVAVAEDLVALLGSLWIVTR